ncbi:MAG: class I SAM-dependent methyltransferase [Candidatus Micrarchaeota archaeon]
MASSLRQNQSNASAEISYRDFEPDFHEEMMNSANPVRRWFHRSKNELILKTVKEFAFDKAKIVDLGCGTVNWNIERLPVLGIDLNPSMLSKAKKEGRLSDSRVASVQKTGLPSQSADVVVISEVLEHLPDFEDAIDEIRRILAPNGVVLATVPYDTIVSLWKPLFFMQCFLHGTLRQNEYFKKEAGHVNHFSPASIAGFFRKHDFEIEKQFDNRRFTIFTVARKKRK